MIGEIAGASLAIQLNEAQSSMYLKEKSSMKRKRKGFFHTLYHATRR